MEEEIQETGLNQDEKELLEALARDGELPELSDLGEARRQFLKRISAASAAILATQILAEQNAFAHPPDESTVANQIAAGETVTVKLNINGAEKTLTLDSRVTLLDALRERLNLTGSKKGCDHGQCGACTVIVDGRRALSCMTLAAMSDGKEITTIEGLAKGEQLHPVQAAFIKHDGFQCGYCTPGQICSAIALMTEAQNGEASFVTANLREKPRSVQLSDEEIRERMSGNICRCGAYPNIVAAIKEVHSGREVTQNWQFAAAEGEKPDETV